MVTSRNRLRVRKFAKFYETHCWVHIMLTETKQLVEPTGGVKFWKLLLLRYIVVTSINHLRVRKIVEFYETHC